MEQKEIEVQTEFNNDSVEAMIDTDDCVVENREEVEDNGNENK